MIEDREVGLCSEEDYEGDFLVVEGKENEQQVWEKGLTYIHY